MPLDAEGRHDLDAMAREVTAATRLVLVCNPNNPTGDRAAARPRSTPSWPSCRATWPWSSTRPTSSSRRSRTPTSRSTCSSATPTSSLLRTFSKVYGLCGLRAGYALGSEEFRLAVDRVRQPFSVNALAQAAAAEAIRHQDEVERRVERTIVERVHVEAELAERGLETTDSQANFAWVGLGERDEAAVVRGLAERGVIVRAGAALGQEGRLRVTFGTRAENDRFLAALGRAAVMRSPLPPCALPATNLSDAAPGHAEHHLQRLRRRPSACPPGIGDLARRPATAARCRRP